MLPAVARRKHAAIWVLIHAATTSLIGLLLTTSSNLGLLYFIPALAISLWFLWLTIQLVRNPSPEQASKAFIASNLYLVIILAALMLNIVIIQA